MTKVVYIVFNIDKANEFEWVAERLDSSKFSLEFISIHSKSETPFKDFCAQHKIPFHHVSYFSKKNIVVAFLKTFLLLWKLKPNVVHAHLFEGGLIGITAAFFAGIKKRIYTRHYATQHHEYAPNGVKYDKFTNLLSTCIIATSKNVEDVLIRMEACPPEKVKLIHHGFPLEDFRNISEERILAIKEKYKINRQPIIGVVSRYLHLKGIQFIIPAFKKILETYPNAMLILANAKGEYKSTIQQLLSTLPSQNYVEIPFESDNAALFKCFDIFVHVPINSKIEAFGQIYIEALAAGIPSIFTLSGVAAEFIVNKENALVVDFENENQIYDALKLLLSNNALSESIIENGYRSLNMFSIEQKMAALEKLYL